LIENCLSYRLH